MFTHKEVTDLLKEFVKHQLDLAQACLPKHQFVAFRKMVLDHHATLKKSLGKDRCGNKQNNGEGGGAMSG